MLVRRLSKDDYKLAMYYGRPLGNDTSNSIVEWLIENVGNEHEDWWWSGYTIALDNKEDMVALKLKFGL
jgi:hypothetical protein